MTWINLLGAAASVIGIGIAIAQTFRYREARRLLVEIRRNRSAEIWGGIALTLQAYDTIEDARELVPDTASALSGKVASARRVVVAQYLQQLRQAVLDEPVFNERVLQNWIANGRLENEWRIAQARRLLDPPSARLRPDSARGPIARARRRRPTRDETRRGA